jgi:large subunit ribosomal protein L1
MPKTGKRYRAARASVPEGTTFAPDEAVRLVKELASAKFDETVDVATRLGVDPKKADQLVRGTVVLPHGTGKTLRVLVIAQGDKEAEAKAAGADFVGVEFIQKIQEGWLDFDVCVATPDLMGKVGPLGRVLGPRGLMPTPKAGTVTFDVGKAVKEIKAGKIEFRVDKTGNVHAPIGKVSFSAEQLADNLGALMDQIVRSRPSSAKGTYLRSVTVSSTMGPAVRIDPNLYRKA